MKVNLQGEATNRSWVKARRDPMIQNIMKRQPEEIVNWWNGATAQQKDDLMLRVVLLSAGLARGEF